MPTLELKPTHKVIAAYYDNLASVNPLKRRYQVFVSSTHEDLKEERRQVLQALLETKCIPTGMELVPAASDAQWELMASPFYNNFLTLSGIPAEVYDYRLGNRSALQWVSDQYRVTKDENGNLASGPNRLE